MTTSRGESLAAPPGAARVPVLALIGVLTIVVGALIIGALGGWFLALLVPITLFTIFVVFRVARTMVREIREGRERRSG